MATALARIFEDDHGLETLILCPKNLVKMWEDYRDQYRLAGQGPVHQPSHRRVARSAALSIDRHRREPQSAQPGREAVPGDSGIHQGKRKQVHPADGDAVQQDLSRSFESASALRPEDQEFGIRPEKLLRELGETEFIRRHQCPVRSLAAFEKSEYADDWRELMRLYLVRRTRSFIQENYAQTDPANGRKYLILDDGHVRISRPESRRPRNLESTKRTLPTNTRRLYGTDVVGTINRLNLPRYGLGNYLSPVAP